MTEPRFPLGAFAVITNGRGEVLLCHRTDYDLWNMPGGGVEDGESPWEAVVRETREEVRLDVVVERLTGVYWKPTFPELVLAFACRVVGGELGTSDEADDARYFPADDLPENISPRQVERIHDALADLDEPALRVQLGPGGREMIERGAVRRSR